VSTNRVVILLSPIFVGLSGAVVAWIANHFPGAPKLDAGELTAVFIAGATFAAGKVALWVRGWQAHESAVADEKLTILRCQ
jgi:ABC-type transport system involved in cytochrome c biogenesis permease subunit